MRQALGGGVGRALIAVPSVVIAVAGCIVRAQISDRDAAADGPPPKTDLQFLTEEMLVDERVVPPLDGTSWGRIVAVPRGAPPPVDPQECGLFLSQGEATQKGLALRSSRGSAIGVELAINPTAVDLAGIGDRCAVFTMDAPGVRSRVRVEPSDFGGLPSGAIGTMMRSETTADGQRVAWDIALIAGYHRGVLVTAEYTPGPRGGAFDPRLASALPDLFRAQVDRLDGF